MTIFIIVLCLAIIIFYIIVKKKSQSKVRHHSQKKDVYEVKVALNYSLNEYVDFVNNLKQAVRSSSLNNFTLDKELNLNYRNEQIDNIISNFIEENFDAISEITNNLLEITKKTSQLNELQLNNIDIKMPHIESYIQQEVIEKLEKTPLFEKLEIEEIKAFLMDLIIKSKAKLIKYHFDAK